MKIMLWDINYRICCIDLDYKHIQDDHAKKSAYCKIQYGMMVWYNNY